MLYKIIDSYIISNKNIYTPDDYFTWNDTEITGLSEKGIAANLESVIIPLKCTSIGYGSFDNKKGYCNFKNFTITENVEILKSGALAGNTQLEQLNINKTGSDFNIDDGSCGRIGIEKINITNKVSRIGNGAFAGLPNLASITCDKRDNELTLMDSCFISCMNLSNAEIYGISKISGRIFNSCPLLKNIHISLKDNADTTSSTIVSECTGLEEIIIDGNIPDNSIIFNGTKSTSGFDITINGDWINIASYAFSGADLISLAINGKMQVISDWAFSDCRKWTSFRVPNTVTLIGDGAFAGCENLTIYVPKTAVIGGNRTFEAVKEVIYY